MWNRRIAERYWAGRPSYRSAAEIIGEETEMTYFECIAIDNETSKIELRELTEVMAENLSETATVVSLNFLGSKTTVWRDRVPSVERVSRSTLMELKHRAVWRDEHAGWIS